MINYQMGITYLNYVELTRLEQSDSKTLYCIVDDDGDEYIKQL